MDTRDVFDRAPILSRSVSAPGPDGVTTVISVVHPAGWPEVRRVEKFAQKTIFGGIERISRQLMTANLVVLTPHPDSDVSALRRAADSVGAKMHQPHAFAPIYEVEFDGRSPHKMDEVLERLRKEGAQIATLSPDYIVQIKQ